ncbi:MAG: hypothetical protein ACYS22_10720 [Planctomycetota bacterium]|jgi:hypothetical protein
MSNGSNDQTEGFSGRLLVLGILLLAVVLASVGLYFRRHGGPTYAMAKLAGYGVDPAKLALEQYEVAVELDRTREALSELHASGASFTEAVTLLGRRSDVLGGPEQEFSLAPREGRTWALFGAVKGGFPVRVGLGEDEPTRAERAFILFYNQLRSKRIEWPLGVAAFGPALEALKAMEPANADLTAVGYQVSEKEPWLLTVTTSDRRARLEILPPRKHQARIDLQDAARIHLDRLREASSSWQDALEPMSDALGTERFAEPYRFQVTELVAWRIAALIPPRGEFTVIAPSLPAPLAESPEAP